MPVNQNDKLRVTAVLNGTEGRVENVFHFTYSSPGTWNDSEVMQELAVQLELVYTPMLTYLPTELTFIEVIGFNVTQAAPMPSVPWPTLTAGTSGGNPQPAGMAAFTLLRTGRKRTFGRKYWGQIAASALDAVGKLSTTAVAAFDSGAANLIVDFVGSETGATVLNGILDKAGVFRTFLSTATDAIFAYQRRRRGGRGI